MKYKKTSVLTFSALLIALDIIFTRFLRFEIYPYDRYSLQFLSHALSGLLFGPIIAAVNCVAGDLVGMIVNSGGLSINPLLTLTFALRGLIYGLILHNKNLRSLPWVGISVAIVTLVCDLALNSFIMSEIFNIPPETVFITKLPFRLASIAVYTFIIWFVWHRLKKIKPFSLF